MTLLDSLDLSTWEALARLGAALGLGAVIGVQREVDGHDAGIRTHALLALGAALFGAMSVGAFEGYAAERAASNVQVDVTRIASYVVAGVGFLAGGTIVKARDKVRGLTTAASLWVASAVGLATGLGLYLAALIATLATLGMLLLGRPIARFVPSGDTSAVELQVTTLAEASALAERIRTSASRIRRVRVRTVGDGVTVEATGLVPTEARQLVDELATAPGVHGWSLAEE